MRKVRTGPPQIARRFACFLFLSFHSNTSPPIPSRDAESLPTPQLAQRTTALTKSEVRFLRIMKCRAKFLDRSIMTVTVCTYPIIHPISPSPARSRNLCALVAFPIVGDVLHTTLSYILIVRPAVKAKYVFSTPFPRHFHVISHHRSFFSFSLHSAPSTRANHAGSRGLSGSA